MSLTVLDEAITGSAQPYNADYLHSIVKRLVNGAPVIVIAQSNDGIEAGTRTESPDSPTNIQSIPIERMLPGDGVPGEEIRIVKEASESMSALEECKEEVDRLKVMLDDLIKHDWEREKLQGLLDAMSTVQRETNTGLELNAAKVEEDGHVARDADVVATGQSVRESFSEFCHHIDALQSALHDVAEQIDSIREKGKHWFLHLRWHIVWAKIRESLPEILRAVVQLISHIGKILALVHPVANVITALADAVHAHLSNTNAKSAPHVNLAHAALQAWRRLPTKYPITINSYNEMKEILNFIREKMPMHVTEVQDMLRDCYTKMEHPMLKVEDQLGTHYVRMMPEDAERAAGVWRQMGDRLDEVFRSHCQETSGADSPRC
ncbi:uncharacterized protein B0H18DRAFT_1117564 [Fomitopsis serialis]|uniref:uncharacterized protein n=1 Tax=Fomitopsis serialis TaxID=139415 RepID=UPI002008D47D|nr:uncharacterized protein B0H18DRAFT_1117564 [Neoantrodia serialis]KAH9929217.1 hypothetical protein B0H18DRAFT_1117564 [Neoantrodia serialis]